MKRSTIRLPAHTVALALGLACALSMSALLGSAAPARAAPASPDIDAALVQGVYARVVAVAARPTRGNWPPPLFSLDGSGIVAAAARVDSDSVVVLLDHTSIGLVMGTGPEAADRLAFVLGHELSHILLGHVFADQPPAVPELHAQSFSRRQELDADRAGAALAVRAGFSFRAGLGALFRLRDAGLDYSSFEGVRVDHPTLKDRLAALDRDKRGLWRAMAAFEDGIVLLASGEPRAAEGCFRAVVEEFADCPEGWTNLGDALLERYMARISSERWRELGIGPIAHGAFVPHAASLEALRGPESDAELWLDADSAFVRAQRVGARSLALRLNRALLRLVPPNGPPRASEAAQFLGSPKKILAARKDGDSDVLTRASVWTVLGVCALAKSQLTESRAHFARAARLLEFMSAHGGGAGASGVERCLEYQQAVVALRAGSPDRERRKALEGIRSFLHRTPRTSPWWTGADSLRSAISVALGEAPDRGAASDSTAVEFLPLRALECAGGRLMRIGERIAEVAPEGSGWTARPSYPGSELAQWTAPGGDVEVLADERVIAIRVRSPGGPVVRLHRAELGDVVATLRIGMTGGELDTLLMGQDFVTDPILDLATPYRIYPTLGLAVRVADGVVQELLLVPARPES